MTDATSDRTPEDASLPDQEGQTGWVKDIEERVEGRTGKTLREVGVVVILSLTAVLTAWCGFESSKWGGEMSIAFSQASSARIQAASADGEARTARSFDLTIYANWVNAVADRNQRLADYIAARFTPEFRVAYDDWEAHGRALPSPFKEPSYVPPGTAKAAELNARANAKFQSALENNARGDRYSLLTVLFALVLFFGAMSGRDFAAWVTRTFLAIAAALLVVGVVILATFPVIV
jgi:hypothetical protein